MMRLITILRGVALLVISLALLVSAPGVIAQHSHDLEEEHRFTSLETRVDLLMSELNGIKAAIQEQNKVFFWQLFALAGLTGEAGIRIIRSRKKE